MYEIVLLWYIERKKIDIHQESTLISSKRFYVSFCTSSEDNIFLQTFYYDYVPFSHVSIFISSKGNARVILMFQKLQSILVWHALRY